MYDQEHLRLLYLNTLFKLMVYHMPQINYLRGLYYGERILSMDNTREMVHRQLMLMYYLSGNRNAALAQYKLCCQILREELVVRQMDETQRLYEHILHN
jgi:two-component SAPR family response regulator